MYHVTINYWYTKFILNIVYDVDIISTSKHMINIDYFEMLALMTGSLDGGCFV